jgi:hypothetical protein
MDERDTITATTDDDTEREPWERAVIPVEPDEPREIEEVEEGEEDSDAGEDTGEVVEGRELVEAEEDEEASLGLRDLQIAANEELRKAGLPELDIGEYMQALAESGAEGLALAEADLPAFISYLDAQLEAGVGAAAIGAGVGWYLRMQAGAEQQRYDADIAERDRMVGELQAQWGPKYEQNIFALKRLVGGMPNGVGDALQAARMPDGTLLINVPGFAETFLQVAKSGARTAPSPAVRLAEISDILANNPQRYFREKLDQEVKLRNRIDGVRDAAEARGEQQPATRREKEILNIMRADINAYFRQGLDRELAAIRAARASRGE